jgi:hypothetical protein
VGSASSTAAGSWRSARQLDVAVLDQQKLVLPDLVAASLVRGIHRFAGDGID